MPPMEVLYRIRRQRPDVFERLEGNGRRQHPTVYADNAC